MKALGILLVICLALAALRAALLVLCAAIVLLFLWGAIFRPAETFSFLGWSTFTFLLQTYPAACLCIIGLAIIAVMVAQCLDHRVAPGADSSEQQPREGGGNPGA